MLLCGSLNDSGITVKECARHSGLASRSANNTVSKRFGNRRPRPWTAAESKRVSTQGRVPFPPARQLSEYKGKGASASREGQIQLIIIVSHSLRLFHVPYGLSLGRLSFPCKC